MPSAGTMDVFVQRRPVVVLVRLKLLERRQRNGVARRRIERLITTVSHGRSDRAKKSFRILQPIELRSRFRELGHRQRVALRDIEDRMRPQERNASDAVFRALIVPFED